MEQPLGFVNLNSPNHACLLNRALYGLKQAPRAWFGRLPFYLLGLCLFAVKLAHLYSNRIMLIYVDDIILTGSNQDMVFCFIHKLNLEFSIKDLGELHYFLGIQVTRTPKGLFLNQSKYALDILESIYMKDCKSISSIL